MAYTIPEYVDTPEQAILAVASAVKGEQVTGGDGSVNKALDILADALAGENVTVPMTQQGAILALAQYVGGGGGGGDFTTASVVFSLDGYTGAPFTLIAPYTFYNEILGETAIDCVINSSEMDGETAVDLVLYKGKLYIEAAEGSNFSAATGDIVITDGWDATITGNGTLTISDEP